MRAVPDAGTGVLLTFILEFSASSVAIQGQAGGIFILCADVPRAGPLVSEASDMPPFETASGLGQGLQRQADDAGDIRLLSGLADHRGHGRAGLGLGVAEVDER